MRAQALDVRFAWRSGHSWIPVELAETHWIHPSRADGFAFSAGDALPEAFRQGAFVGLHGS